MDKRDKPPPLNHPAVKPPAGPALPDGGMHKDIRESGTPPPPPPSSGELVTSENAAEILARQMEADGVRSPVVPPIPPKRAQEPPVPTRASETREEPATTEIEKQNAPAAEPVSYEDGPNPDWTVWPRHYMVLRWQDGEPNKTGRYVTEIVGPERYIELYDKRLLHFFGRAARPTHYPSLSFAKRFLPDKK